MKKLRLLLAILLAAVVAVLIPVLSPQPSDAISLRNQQMLDLGLIDDIRTPAELGLDYLEQPAQPIEISSILDTIRRVPEELAQDFTNGSEPVGVDLGTNYPVGFGDLPDGGELASASDYTAVDYVNNTGQPQSITPNEIGDMATVEANKGGIFTAHNNSNEEGVLASLSSQAEHHLIADASGILAQGRRVPVVDLIVYNNRNGRYSLVPNVNINAFCRDAVNGALTHSLHRLR